MGHKLAPFSTSFNEVILLLLYTTTIFLSSILLFIVQPMFGKMLLPYLGSSPNVWNTCMFFFQGVLLLGYLYAHVLTSFFGVSKQSKLHIVLLIFTLFLLPVGIPACWVPPTNKNPIFDLIFLLTTTVGLPFFMLSVNAPMLQKWFSKTGHYYSNDPYFLYVASNLGSMIALISYPFLIEPNLNLILQSDFWAVGFWILGGLVFVLASKLWKTTEQIGNASFSTDNSLPVEFSIKYKWILLSFIPSSLLFGVTTFLSTDIATVPLLWIVPLTIYLLTFIIVFSKKPIFSHELITKAMPIMIVAVLFQMISAQIKDISLTILIHLLTFFISSMACHGELAKSRPSVKHLTEFYLWISVGGFLGGLFNALIAPIVFKTVIEYPLGIVLACLVMPKTSKEDNKSSYLLDLVLPNFILLSIFIFINILPGLKITSAFITNLFLFGIPAITSLFFIKRPIRFGLTIGVIFLACSFYVNLDEKNLYIERSFFGVNKVTLSKDGKRHYLIHGHTKHGAQNLDSSIKNEPLTYYYKTGPIGQFFKENILLNSKSNIGVIGLGAGTLITYGKEGQNWIFYEIDPIVVKIARNQKYFTFLQDSKIKNEVVLGDGRISIKKTQDHIFDLIVLDAFSSDSIPAHLLTKEAMQIYLQKLKNNGVLAFHISNKFLNLEPILSALAKDSNLIGLIQYDLNINEEESLKGKDGSVWVILSRENENLDNFLTNKKWKILNTSSVKLWTDSFSNIFSVIRWNNN